MRPRHMTQKEAKTYARRIHVLSEIPREWHTHFRRWSSWNRDKKSIEKGPKGSFGRHGVTDLSDSPRSVAARRERKSIDFGNVCWPLSLKRRARLSNSQVGSTLTKRTKEPSRDFISQILEPASSRRFLADFPSLSEPHRVPRSAQFAFASASEDRGTRQSGSLSGQ